MLAKAFRFRYQAVYTRTVNLFIGCREQSAQYPFDRRKIKLGELLARPVWICQGCISGCALVCAVPLDWHFGLSEE